MTSALIVAALTFVVMALIITKEGMPKDGTEWVAFYITLAFTVSGIGIAVISLSYLINGAVV